ncbi:hypothetical protein ABKN59_010259 [Abortiporus biennis]
MSSNVTNTTLPNPFTPLAFLPPDIAHQVQVAQLLIMTVIGAWMWDYLMSLYEEYSMFAKHKLALSDLVYALSRIVAISYIAVLIIYVGGPIAHTDCNQVDKAATWTGQDVLPRRWDEQVNESIDTIGTIVLFSYRGTVRFFNTSWSGNLGRIPDSQRTSTALVVEPDSLPMKYSVPFGIHW